jgi:5-methylcytosine-specific restriction endonuclease McrA
MGFGMTKTFSRITHYIPPATKFLDLEKEFIEPNSSDSFIWFLYRYRCAECKQPGQEVNEIRLRSRSKRNIEDWKNRILLCRTCHEKFHHNGVTSDKINDMIQLRTDYLVSIGREQYV